MHHEKIQAIKNLKQFSVRYRKCISCFGIMYTSYYSFSKSFLFKPFLFHFWNSRIPEAKRYYKNCCHKVQNSFHSYIYRPIKLGSDSTSLRSENHFFKSLSLSRVHSLSIIALRNSINWKYFRLYNITLLL